MSLIYETIQLTLDMAIGHGHNPPLPWKEIKIVFSHVWFIITK